MPDTRRLQDKLEKLGAPLGALGDGGRMLVPAAGSDFAAAILQEIDETILARRLAFVDDADMTMALEVKNRRVLRVCALPEHGALKTHRGLLDQPLPETGQSPALVAMIRDFVAETKSLHVAAASLTRHIDADEIGCSAQSLAVAMGLSLYGDTGGGASEPPVQLVPRCQEMSLAWLSISVDGARQSFGDPAGVERLLVLSKSNLNKFNNVLDGVIDLKDGWRCLVLAAATDQALSILVLETGREKLFCLITGNQLPAIVANSR